MIRPTTPAARLARAGILGAVSLALAVGAHLLGGGVLPGVGTLLALSVALGALALPLTTRRVRLAPLVTLLGVEQAALHVALAAGALAPGCGGHHSGAVAACLTPTGDPTPDLAMVVAHLLSLVATAWLLARGEAWLWRLGTTAYARATRRPTVRRVRPEMRAFAPHAPQVLVPVLVSVRRRGPPPR